VFLAPPWSLLSPPHTFSLAKIPHTASPNTLLFDFFYSTWHEGIQGKAMIRFELSLDSSQADEYRPSLKPLSTGYFPSPEYFLPGGQLSESTGVCFKISKPYPSYAYSPADPSFPPNPSSQVLAKAGDRYAVTLVPLIEGVPKAACAFSGRVICRSEVDQRVQLERESILCVDYLA
jgi:hypothetical protein